jgi:hypothetical protein
VGVDTIHDGFFSQQAAPPGAVFKGFSRQKTRQQARRFDGLLAPKCTARKALEWLMRRSGAAQILAARSMTSSNNTPVVTSMCSIAPAASLTELVEVSMISSLWSGGW